MSLASSELTDQERWTILAEQLHMMRTAHNNLAKRLAALEAHPVPEYAPGWTEGNGLFGMRANKGEGYDVMIAYNAGSDVARITVFGYSEDDNQSAMAMKNDLLRLRDNITEVLKRMEMGVE